MGEPARRFAVTPCTSAPTTPGVFFSHEGGHVLLDEAMEVASKLDLLLEVSAAPPLGAAAAPGSPGRRAIPRPLPSRWPGDRAG
ncbi:laminin subunit alpha-4-like [Petromyzon marinus]|uniref:laminin subunit alpha-4-like n=1 Tax=Petromyzon marinus TaxID=7757 RepID=UPI003F6FAF11